jgi:gamma-glutamyl:cysteine ligase YbdK (ATP-grasp superfamily)
MGDEIKSDSFSKEAEECFHENLREETKVLNRFFKEEAFCDSAPMCGLEIEGWLTNKDFIPAPLATEFLKTLDHKLVVPEISLYNFEINSEPLPASGWLLSILETNTLEIWKLVEEAADKHDLLPFTIGTLPTLRDYMLSMKFLTPGNRYTVLNDRILASRKGRPLTIDIEGKEAIYFKQDNVITECAATSLQIHYGVSQLNSKDFYNASIVSSCFMAAISANSPFFFGHDLWSESRVRIFEQSVESFSYRTKDGDFSKRVSLGNGYIKNSLMELFLENLDGHPALLPEVFQDSDPDSLSHFKLQNGTVWRWNRPIVGTSKEGRPNLRMEFRVPSSGPSIVDSIGNIAFQIALVEYLRELDDLTELIPFSVAEDNFYNACKYGMEANIKWVDGEKHNIRTLMATEILPRCIDTLNDLSYDSEDIEKYLVDVIG